MNESTQTRVGRWVTKTLGPRILFDRQERALRLVEEAIELAQAEGVGPVTIGALTARVFSRPVGLPSQEAGGVGVTLLAWGEAASASVPKLVQAELVRIEQPHIAARCRAKQNEKAALGLGLPTGD